MIRLLGIPLLLAGVTTHVATQSVDVYQVLTKSAVDPANRRAVCEILADDLHTDGQDLAELYRTDKDPYVRTSCYQWLITKQSAQQSDWLLKGLADPSETVRARAVANAGRVIEWSPEVWGSLWNIFQTCQRARVLELAARALVKRGGAETARAVFELAGHRGSGWLPYTISALALHPQEAFREVFEAATAAQDWDHSCLARRCLAALGDEQWQGKDCRTIDEYYELWRAPSVSTQIPKVLDWGAFVVRLRQKRVIILGEMHGDVAGRATQIAVLIDRFRATKNKVVLIWERGLQDYQKPVLAAAEQYQIEMRTLESEALAMNESPAKRDEVARKELVKMVAEEPNSVFVVCYGNNHRRSFHTALTEAGISCAAVALSGDDGMLASSMRATQGRVQGRCFDYGNNLYYLPSGSYATLLGAPGLDLAFLPN